MLRKILTISGNMIIEERDFGECHEGRCVSD